MALTPSIHQDLGSLAPDFSLPGVDRKTYSLKSFESSRALLVIFMCNHCPYVIAVQERINQLAKDFQAQGVSLIGINSNDSVSYPADSFEAMQARAREQGYAFPYVQDETQATAQAYGAACTPDPFLYENLGDGKFALRYHGRIDNHWKDPGAVTQRDLRDAIQAILSGTPVRADQVPSLGCSIKWKPNR